MKRSYIALLMILTMWFGFTGIQRFIKKQYFIGAVYLLTFGLLGVGWLYDIIKVIIWSFKAWPKDKIQLIKLKEKQIQNRQINKDLPTKKEKEKPKKITQSSIAFINQSALEYEKCYLLPTDFVVLDFETTGFSYNADEIIEIGAIKYINFEVVDKFETIVNPGIEISKKIQSITGLTNEELKRGPFIDFVLPKLLDFIGDDIIIAHNAPFDVKFLLWNIARLNISYKKFKAIDTLKMAQKLIPTENHQLETLKNYLNLNNHKSHSATEDCFVTGELYKHCYNLVNKPIDEEKTKYFNNVKQILLKNNLDISLLKFNETQDKYNFIKYYYPIFEFKTGKKIYGLTKKSKEEVLVIWNEAVLEDSTKSEHGNTRIILNSPDDIFKVADIILENYRQVIKRMEEENLFSCSGEYLKGYYY
jgi:DNA polymerase-3 subunit epsilon